MTPDRIGWILIHSPQMYSDGDPATPQDELTSDYEPGMLWHWKLPRPLKEGGPYTLLFAWDGKIFGEASADVMHANEKDPRYNFAFKLSGYEARKPVALADLPVPRRHRSLLVINELILRDYRRLAGAQRRR